MGTASANAENGKTVIITGLCTFIVLLLLFIATRESNNESHEIQKIRDLNSIFANQQQIVEPETPVPKIAYLFAGSARSFVCPKVHWSIRSHLIDSLGGESYTFVRISTEDNINTKTGGGMMWTPEFKANEISETLKVLNPREVEYFSFANQLKEMKANYPSEVHAVFRENDLRRYSMFYHRCMAYKLATKYEQQNNIRFDWVVLIRLDAMWLDPVMPIQAYANDRVWVTETGFELFNDQFMLIPRQFSDHIYDLNTKVQKGVYCLGGPDVEKWKCNATELTLRQKKKTFPSSQAFIDRTMEYCCSDRDGIDEEGFSESIHKRHLAYGKIPIALARFPVMLTRITTGYTCQVECERLSLHSKELLANTINKQYKYLSKRSTYDTRATALIINDQTRCAWIRKDEFPWAPLSAAQLHQVSAVVGASTSKSVFRSSDDGHNKKHYVVDYSKPLYTQHDALHPSILMNPRELEMWRIHPTWNVEGCLTFSFVTHNTSWKDCRDHMRHAGGNRGNPEQTFFLQVIPHPEITSSLTAAAAAATTTTVSSSSAAVGSPHQRIPTPLEAKVQSDYTLQYDSISKNQRNTTRVMIPNRMSQGLWVVAPFYCLTIMRRSASSGKLSVFIPDGTTSTHKADLHGIEILMMECDAQNPLNPSQLFQTVTGLTRGTHHKTTVGRFHVASAPHLCLSRSGNEERGHANYPETDVLSLLPCFKEGAQQQILFEFELAI